MKDQTTKDQKIYGLSACLRFVEQGADRVVRAYFLEKTARKFSSLMKALAKEKKVYRIVSAEELEKLTKSQHHEGVCLVVQSQKIWTLSEWFQQKRKKDVLIYLDGVSNPHNLGAIARVCAHFGVSAILHPNPKLLQSGAAVRTAEGGAEFVDLVECADLKKLITHAKGYQVFSTSSHHGKSLYDIGFKSRVLFILGEEQRGLPLETLQSTRCLRIEGTGHVESLNVATSVAVLLSEVWRQDKG